MSITNKATFSSCPIPSLLARVRRVPPDSFVVEQMIPCLERPVNAVFGMDACPRETMCVAGVYFRNCGFCGIMALHPRKELTLMRAILLLLSLMLLMPLNALGETADTVTILVATDLHYLAP